MKEIFERLRRGMIKKLGGYTEQFPPLQPQIIRQVDVQTQRLQAQISIAAPPPGVSAIDFNQHCKRQVTERLVQHLEESEYIRWESEYKEPEQTMNVRATLFVVNAEYMEPQPDGQVD